MELYMCESCGEVYVDELGCCPKASCEGGRILAVDEMIFPAVKILTEKGYAVDGSCSGHFVFAGTIPQVNFSRWWTEGIDDAWFETTFDNLPAHWNLTIHTIPDPSVNGTSYKLVSLTHDVIDVADDVERYYAVIEANLSLLDFVRKLEPASD